MGIPKLLSHSDRGTVVHDSMLPFFQSIKLFFISLYLHPFFHSLIKGQLLHARHCVRCYIAGNKTPPGFTT